MNWAFSLLANVRIYPLAYLTEDSYSRWEENIKYISKEDIDMAVVPLLKKNKIVILLERQKQKSSSTLKINAL